MVVVLLIFLVGLAPACISAWYTWTAERSTKARVIPAYGRVVISQSFRDQGDLHYVDGLGYMIGDITCDLNAHSPYLRCAVNPIGPCDGCHAYTPKMFDRQI